MSVVQKILYESKVGACILIRNHYNGSDINKVRKKTMTSGFFNAISSDHISN